MKTKISRRRQQINEALAALQAHEHRSYKTVVETHRSGTYYSARIEPKHERQDTEAKASPQNTRELAEAL